MPLIRCAADAFGLVTICLLSTAAFLGFLCIYRSVYFQLHIRRRGFLQLRYFNGPWFSRITLILIAIWWGLGEIVRLTLLKGSGRPFPSLRWQKDVCKFYIVSNLGFAEPCILLMLVFLLHASLQRRDLGTLSPRWNRKTIGYVLLVSLPVFLMQLFVILISPRIASQKIYVRKKLAMYFASSAMSGEISICTYPAMGAMILGLFDLFLLSYVLCIGRKVVLLVINKGLRRRLYVLLSTVYLLIPARALLLGFSALTRKGHLLFEAMVFTAFFMQLLCIAVGICMLVYLPITDSLALGDLGNIGMQDMPYDDYFNDGAALIGNQNHQQSERNSDTSMGHGSISFHAMINYEPSASSSKDIAFLPSNSLHIATPTGPSEFPIRPMVQLT